MAIFNRNTNGNFSPKRKFGFDLKGKNVDWLARGTFPFSAPFLSTVCIRWFILCLRIEWKICPLTVNLHDNFLAWKITPLLTVSDEKGTFLTHTRHSSRLGAIKATSVDMLDPGLCANGRKRHLLCIPKQNRTKLFVPILLLITRPKHYNINKDVSKLTGRSALKAMLKIFFIPKLCFEHVAQYNTLSWKDLNQATIQGRRERNLYCVLFHPSIFSFTGIN